jgi:hypothetical protein
MDKTIPKVSKHSPSFQPPPSGGKFGFVTEARYTLRDRGRASRSVYWNCPIAQSARLAAKSMVDASHGIMQEEESAVL